VESQLPIYKVTRHVWKWITVGTNDATDASRVAEEDGDWEESPDYDEWVELKGYYPDESEKGEQL